MCLKHLAGLLNNTTNCIVLVHCPGRDKLFYYHDLHLQKSPPLSLSSSLLSHLFTLLGARKKEAKKRENIKQLDICLVEHIGKIITEDGVWHQNNKERHFSSIILKQQSKVIGLKVSLNIKDKFYEVEKNIKGVIFLLQQFPSFELVSKR